MKLVTVTVSGNTVTVQTPYYPLWARTARGLGGDWKKPVWVFDARVEPEVRAKLMHFYGENDSGEVERVTVQINLDEVETGTAQLCMLGRVVAERKERDDRVRLSPGVAVVEGGFSGSGGSVKNPSINPLVGTVLKVFDVPRSLADRTCAKYAGVTILGVIAPPAAEPEPEPEPVAPPAAAPGASPSQGVNLLSQKGEEAHPATALSNLLTEWAQERSSCEDDAVTATDAEYAFRAGLPTLAALHRLTGRLADIANAGTAQVGLREIQAELRKVILFAAGEANARAALLGCQEIPGMAVAAIPVMEQMVRKGEQES